MAAVSPCFALTALRVPLDAREVNATLDAALAKRSEAWIAQPAGGARAGLRADVYRGGGARPVGVDGRPRRMNT